jgi:hypothetical protein
MLPVDLRARTARKAAIRLRAKKGSFFIKEVLNVLREVILLKGYQSKSRSTAGRLTAMGLLRRARMKKKMERM